MSLSFFSVGPGCNPLLFFASVGINDKVLVHTVYVLLRFKTQPVQSRQESYGAVQAAPCGTVALGTSGLEGPGRLRP